MFDYMSDASNRMMKLEEEVDKLKSRYFAHSLILGSLWFAMFVYFVGG